MKSINANIEEELYQFKTRSGMTWSGIIRRGIESMTNAHNITELKMENDALKKKIEMMSEIIQRFNK